MNSKYAIKPDDSISEIRSKHDERFKYFIDDRNVYDWLHTVCSIIYPTSTRWLSIQNQPKFATLIKQECLKNTLFKHLESGQIDMVVKSVLKSFLAIDQSSPTAIYWWTSAAMFHVINEGSVNHATFCKWNYGIPLVFRDIATEFFNFEHGSGGSLEIITIECPSEGSDTNLDLPQIPYLSGFYNHHCDLLYEELDEVLPCHMLSYLMAKGLGHRSHLLAAKLRVRGITIWALEDVVGRHKLKNEGVFTDVDIAKLS